MDKAKFFAAVRSSLFGGKLTSSQVDGMEVKLDAFADAKWPVAYAAYGLATSYLETGRAMVPVREKGNGDGPDADKFDDYLQKYDTGRLAHALGNTPEADGDGVKYAGRSDVQLTGLANYRKAGKAIGVDLVAHPDLALDPKTSAWIMVWGMGQGGFTGKKLSDYFTSAPGTLGTFRGARRIINGQDRAGDVAQYALKFQNALIAAGYGG